MKKIILTGLLTTFFIFTLMGCSGASKSLVPYNEVKQNHYTISTFAKKSLFQSSVNPNIYSINYTVANVFHKSNPYVEMGNDYRKIFQTICDNSQGKMSRGKNSSLSKHIKSIHDNKKIKYKDRIYNIPDTMATMIHELQTKECLRTNGRNCKTINNSYLIKGTNAPTDVTHYICKNGNKELFSYYITPSYFDVVKSLTNKLVPWWNMDVAVNINK